MFTAADCHLCSHLKLVLSAVTNPDFMNSVVQLPTARSPLSPIIADNPKFFPFFKDAVGAIDGTHIAAFVDDDVRARYRDREGNITTNLLAACTFEMLFCYLLGGWEGSASDSFVFEEARGASLTVPPGKYFLADAGFPSCDALLVPYRNVRYHLREWGAVGLRYVYMSLKS